MNRVNYRTIVDRFKHIDAEFVDCRCGFKGSDSFYQVRFYPWWEHPAYIKAINKGNDWGFYNTDAGAKEVTVYPINPILFHLSLCTEVINWTFLEQHPILWSYEDDGQIFINRDFDIEKLIDAVLKRKLPFVTDEILYKYLNSKSARKAPYSLGYFPKPLFTVIQEELNKMRIPVFIPHIPKCREIPIVFFIDNEDYIIADDFEIEVPDFEHRPEFFCPHGKI